MDKASFMHYLAIRFAHEPDKINEIIDRGETLAKALEARGYGFERAHAPAMEPMPTASTIAPTLEREKEPNRNTWDGLPPAKPLTVGHHPAYAPFIPVAKEPTQAELLADLRHWEKLAASMPIESAIAILNPIRQKLGMPMIELETMDQDP